MHNFKDSGVWDGLHVGKYQLFISDCRVDHDTVPKGLYVYDMRHTDSGCMGGATIEDHVLVNFNATVVSPVPIKFRNGRSYYTINNYSYNGEAIDAKEIEQWFKDNQAEKPLTARS